MPAGHERRSESDLFEGCHGLGLIVNATQEGVDVILFNKPNAHWNLDAPAAALGLEAITDADLKFDTYPLIVECQLGTNADVPSTGAAGPNQTALSASDQKEEFCMAVDIAVEASRP
jgi:hypothetical protein